MQKIFSKYFILRIHLATALFFVCHTKLLAQDCPPNIDFEAGTFDNWTCYTGSVAAVAGQNVISLVPSGGPSSNQHTMYSAGAGNDKYGDFPINCPNGSGHSIKLGNDQGGGLAEGISYEFTIPAGRNTYSIIYHYAVVFQDPNHQPFQQPRLEIEAKNLSDDEVIDCSSFTFFPNGSLLPGFYISPIRVDTTNVWCKDWTAVSINLNDMAGKTIRLFFKTADCTFTRHFGYAYIDINSECSSEFVGATYCPDDTAIRVTAPYGYQSYNWYSSDFTRFLGNQQVIDFSPPPPPGTTIAVEIIPYDGYGCRDTLFALLVDTLKITADAGINAFSCNGIPVQIGVNPKPNVVYQWSPVTGLSNPNISNPRAGPLTSTKYTLTARSFGGGCVTTDDVDVGASVVDTTVSLQGKIAYCITSGDSTVLNVTPVKSIQWYRNNIPINGAIFPRYKVTQSGLYHALLINDKGCSLSTSDQNVILEIPKRGITYPVVNAVINYSIPLKARDFGAGVLWKPSLYLSNTTIFTPNFKGLEEQFYTIDIKTPIGCTSVDTQLVKVFKEIKFYVPSAFTPNNDGLNDYLKPVQAGIKELKYFRVYHRWGQLIFDLNNNELGWDGKIKGILQTTQVVVWMAEGIGYDGKVYQQKGTCLLVR